jgi:hypothetical protein
VPGGLLTALQLARASDNGAHFVVLLPAKPASVTRPVDLDGPRST